MRSRKLVTIILLLLLALAWVVGANPFNFFVRKSAHFSKRAFRSIEVGANIEEVFDKLGDPIEVLETKQDLGCPGCTAYYFMGDPPAWLPSFEEAWVLADQNGRVVQVIEHAEP